MNRRFKRRIKRMKKRIRRLRRELTKPRYYPIYAFISVIFLLISIFPDRFSDYISFYYWEPMMSKGSHLSAIYLEYNPVNLITYGMLTIISIYLIYVFFERHRISFDRRTILASMPLIVSIGIMEPIRNTSIVSESIRYVFSFPVLYAWIGFMALFLLLYSEFLERRTEYEAMVLSVLPYPIMVRVFWFLSTYSTVKEGFPWFVSMILIYSFIHLCFAGKKGFERDSSFFLYSMFFLTMSSYYVSYIAVTSNFSIYAPSVILSISFAISVAVYALAPYTGELSTDLRDISNQFIIFSQALNGISISYTVLYYKGNAWIYIAMFISSMAFLISIFIVYLLDKVCGGRLKESAKGMIKFTLILMGLATGIYHMLVLSIGM